MQRANSSGVANSQGAVVGSMSSALTGSYIQSLTNRDFASGAFRRI